MKYSGPAFDRIFTQWPDDVSHMRASLRGEGIFVTKETAIRAWMAASQVKYDGGWRIPYGPNVTADLREFLVDDATMIDEVIDEADPIVSPYPWVFSMREQKLIRLDAPDAPIEEPPMVAPEIEPVVAEPDLGWALVYPTLGEHQYVAVKVLRKTARFAYVQGPKEEWRYSVRNFWDGFPDKAAADAELEKLREIDKAHHAKLSAIPEEPVVEPAPKRQRAQPTGYFASHDKLREAVMNFEHLGAKAIASKTGVGVGTVYTILREEREKQSEG